MLLRGFSRELGSFPALRKGQKAVEVEDDLLVQLGLEFVLQVEQVCRLVQSRREGRVLDLRVRRLARELANRRLAHVEAFRRLRRRLFQ